MEKKKSQGFWYNVLLNSGIKIIDLLVSQEEINLESYLIGYKSHKKIIEWETISR